MHAKLHLYDYIYIDMDSAQFCKANKRHQYNKCSVFLLYFGNTFMRAKLILTIAKVDNVD